MSKFKSCRGRWVLWGMGKKITTVDVVSVTINRNITALKRDAYPGDEHIEELAIGKESSQLFLRTISGRLYIVDVPMALAEELSGTSPAAAGPVAAG